ncbi:flippase-like domain-containing protein [Rubripirellula amarantea]|uniref:Lysylphosphatidylglycerol synthase TM region n=1 Tax=Rubripirellula amarantea TaxID=2527999 RepID=A0A5C5WTY7_9BACT|nr:hypothetical protein [Rubripirellula amarantea]MDA8742996.1 flippase-like domain-containing protein [Rubripirellula amarantea]TWT53659.1 hypothetical protein Pla22_12890 [Rubripirellula amarantea]
MNARETAPSAKTRRRALLMQLTKVVIAIVVAIGLVLAARSAAENWSQQHQRIETEIGTLDRQISLESDPDAQHNLRQQRSVLESQLPEWKNIRIDLLLMAALIYAIGLLPPAAVLRTNCGLFGPRPRWSTSIASQLLGHVGKYVPGKAMVVVLRVGALRRDKIKPLAGTVSVFAETFMMMAVGAAIAGIVTLKIPVPSWINMTALAMAIAATAPTLPPIMKIVIARVGSPPPSSDRSPDQLDTAKGQMGWSWFASVWTFSIASWLLIGASFAITVAAMPGSQPLPNDSTLYPLALSAIGLAMALGFASLLPGGAGVRELVLITILGISIDPTRALLAAIAARMIFIIVEGLLAIVSWIWLRKDAHNSYDGKH